MYLLCCNQIQPELGARFEESFIQSPKIVTMVTNIVSGGESSRLGVTIGSIVVGVQGEKYISHAHTIATLKHSKRPVKVRFRKSMP